jgi:hypothetical protein
MPTSIELRALGGDLQFAHVILFDGVQDGAFADHADLVGFTTGTGHNVRLGFQREAALRMAIDLRTGQFEDSTSTFTVIDFEGDLVSLFAAIDPTERPLTDVPVGAGTNIAPGDDLSARTELHGRYIGTERIGSSGARHQYSCVPGFDVGLEHQIVVPALDLAASPVSDRPLVWAGRRCAVYRIYRDHVTYPDPATGPSSWRPFSEATRVWWGTLKDQGVVSGHEWRFEADGPESWLRKPLGVGYQTRPVVVVANVTLSSDPENDETGIGIEMLVPTGGVGFQQFGSDDFSTSISASTPEDVRADVSAAVAALASAGGVDGAWLDQAGWVIELDATSGNVRIGIDPNLDSHGRMHLCLHRKAWAIMGYDVTLQTALAVDAEDGRALIFFPAEMPGSSFSDAPGPDYWVGRFVTGDNTSEYPRGGNNGGLPRRYTPFYRGGTYVLRADLDGGQVVRLGDATLGGGTSQSTIAHRGQLDRPPASDPNNPSSPYALSGGNVDRQGLVLFYGKRRFENEEDTVDEYQVGRCSWRNAAGQQDGLINGDIIVVNEWLEPARFGFNRPKLESDWVARVNASDDNIIHAAAILDLGYQSGSAYD